VRGSCLTASLEMMVDWLKAGDRKAAYSTFRNAVGMNGFTKQGHPNGNEFTHLMWNQATLHFTIYCSAQRLIELLDFFNIPTHTISFTPPLGRGGNEMCEQVMNRANMKQRIKQLIFDEHKPVIALVNNMRIRSEQDFPHHNDQIPFSQMHPSHIHHEPTPQGHAVVLAGYDLSTEHVLVLDPSPSIELENHPGRFYNTEPMLSNPNIHRHRVDLDSFVNTLQQTRSLITFDSELDP
jgi:hypothetical protein